jgi:pyruvate formate lyase activating enzyme
MSATRGLLNDFIRFSNVDGPGNRFVAFLQGCNFNCIFCHNPYTINTCVDCGICVEPCPEDALVWGERGAGVEVDWSLCNLCGVCVDICPYDSTPLARRVTVDGLWEEIRETAPFLSGVTISGGEPTLQASFVEGLFAAIKARPETTQLTTLIDSNGSCSIGIWEELLGVMDGAMLDLKALDEETHLRLTGVSNNRVLDSIRFLADHNRLYEVRLPLVPGINDSDEMLARTARWLLEIDPKLRVKVIGYRRQGVRTQYGDLLEPSPSQMDRYARVLTGEGFPSIVQV